MGAAAGGMGGTSMNDRGERLVFGSMVFRLSETACDLFVTQTKARHNLIEVFYLYVALVVHFGWPVKVSYDSGDVLHLATVCGGGQLKQFARCGIIGMRALKTMCLRPAGAERSCARCADSQIFPHPFVIVACLCTPFPISIKTQSLHNL